MNRVFSGVADHYSNTSLFPLSSGTVVMITMREAFFIAMCLQGFFYGLYSGIFAIYLKCQSKTSWTTTIIFYAICLLYVLSTVAFVCDWVDLILTNGVVLHIRTLSLQLQIDSHWQSMLLRLYIARGILNDCCDSIAQFILIYRCWIVWGKNIRVVIIPSFLAISYLGQLIQTQIYLPSHLIADSNLSPLATSLVLAGAVISVQLELVQLEGQTWISFIISDWGDLAILTSYAMSLAVNLLVTGLIVFKILKVFLEVRATTTSVERTLGSTAGGTKLQHIIFVIIESGMALFAVQLVRFVLFIPGLPPLLSPPNIYDLVISINQMFIGITPTIILVRVSMRLSFNDEESFMEVAGSLCFNNPSSDPDIHRGMGTLESNSSSSISLQEGSEDICLNNRPSDPKFSNTLRRMGSSNSMLPQERSGDTY